FYWSELRVGDDLPPLTKPAIDRVQIVRYAASSGDFNRLHLDEPYAHAVGFPGLFAPGMLAMAFVGQLLTAWLRRGHVRKLGARFIKIVWPGDELTCHGRIAELRRETGACYAAGRRGTPFAEACGAASRFAPREGGVRSGSRRTCPSPSRRSAGPAGAHRPGGTAARPRHGGDRRRCTSVRGGSAPVVDLALS